MIDETVLILRVVSAALAGVMSVVPKPTVPVLAAAVSIPTVPVLAAVVEIPTVPVPALLNVKQSPSTEVTIPDVVKVVVPVSDAD